jgi:hypothetical protein
MAGRAHPAADACPCKPFADKGLGTFVTRDRKIGRAKDFSVADEEGQVYDIYATIDATPRER